MDQIRKRMEKLKQIQKGFTLVELIVVIAIIGVLAGVMLPRYFGFTDDARKASAISEAKSIRTIAETYYAANGVWPEVIGTSPFKIQTENVDPATGLKSPDFTGTINVADGVIIPSGAFVYTKNSKTGTCSAEGVVQ